MTVSDPGAGQQQGREELTRYYCPSWHQDDGGWCLDQEPHLNATEPCRLCGRTLRNDQADEVVSGLCLSCLHGPAPSPTPPTRDSGQEEAREAVARLENLPESWDQMAEAAGVGSDYSAACTWEDAAVELRQLLALPELDKLLRRPA